MRILWLFTSKFLKVTWRLINFIREFVLNLLLLFLVIAGLSLWVQFKTLTSNAYVPKGALVLDLSGVVVDKPTVNKRLSKVARYLLGSNNDHLEENSLFQLAKAIHQAKTDSRITGIVLDLKNFSGGDQPSLQYIGKYLRDFRDSGKPIFAIGDNYSQAQYYLASFANKIYLSPQGSIDLHGFATNSLYFKSLLDKLKVSSHIFRVGTYKSAVEPLLRDNMSPAAREADTRWVSELWSNYLHQLAANRQITPEQVFPGASGLIAALQQTDGDTSRYAREAKLVDEVASQAEVEQQLIRVFGEDSQGYGYRGTSVYNYPLQDQVRRGNIAVVFVNGAIVDGEDTPGSAGGDTIAAQIREARLNDDIKAIVLRVNSPGGSVTASETIRQELAAAKTAGKPIIVSMGGMAASGGYWISTPGNYIIASPTTLTGSIGIFGVINTVEKSLDDIGVHTDGVSTSPLADVTVTKALPKEVQQIMQISIQRGYKNFIDLVAKSRNKTPEQVDNIAQGHVWTGSDALSNGLVDNLGDFDDAVAKAAELAKIDNPVLNWYQDETTFTDLLLAKMEVYLQSAFSGALLTYLPAPVNSVLNTVKKQPGLFDTMNDPQHRYAICLTCGNVR